MIGDQYATTDEATGANFDGPRHTGASGNRGISPYSYTVGNLNEVIEPHP